MGDHPLIDVSAALVADSHCSTVSVPPFGLASHCRSTDVAGQCLSRFPAAVPCDPAGAATSLAILRCIDAMEADTGPSDVNRVTVDHYGSAHDG